METIDIFGHKNPDTDSVCAAISLSYLKNQLGFSTAPKVLGHINLETKYVLNHFHIKEPDYLNNVKVQLRNVDYHKGFMVNENASVKSVVDFLQNEQCTAVPIINDKKALTGLITLKEIAMLFIKESQDHLYTSYEEILKCLNGREVLKFQNEFDGNIIAGSYQSQTFIEKALLNPSDILIVGDRFKVIKHGIEANIALIVLTNNFDLDPELVKLAKENKVSVISSAMDTYHTCNAIALSNYVKTLLKSSNPAVVHDTDYLTDFVAEATKLGFTNYPILNKKDECLGLIRVTDVGKFKKKPIILVDHNNLEQSVTGIDEAEIMEIIDHHNLGAIGTNIPINFRSMPVGCTCTIIYGLYKESHVDIPESIAGLMLSAILSDTLILKSPTTTVKDKEAVVALSVIAHEEYQQYGFDMLKAGSSIAGLSITDVIYQDFKSYKVGNETLGISQIVTMDYDQIKEHIFEYVDKLNELSKNYPTVVLFITDVIKNGSYILFNTDSKHIMEDSFEIENIQEGDFISDMVSRKKQMLPRIMEYLKNN